MKCKLCQSETELIKKSHIIPEFFYEASGVYNEKHKMHRIEVQEFLSTKKKSFSPIG